MRPMILALLLTTLSLSPLQTAAADTYYAIGFNDLELTDGAFPRGEQSWTQRWRNRPAMRPFALLDGDGEAFVTIDWGMSSSSSTYGEARLAIRVPDITEPQDITGTLYVAHDVLDGMHALRFKVPASAASDAARIAFYQAQEATYLHLLTRDLPGAAWFRHQASVARQAHGQAQEDSNVARPMRAAPRPSELEDTFLLFTGSRAVSENLQLDRALPPPTDGEELVALDSIEGVTVAEMDWGPLVADLRPELDPLAVNLPADQHALFFPDFAAMVAVLDEATRTGTPVLDLLEPRAEDARTKERYESQLCLTVNALSRLLGPQVIASVAMTGSDPYLRVGSDVAILFEAKQLDVLVTYLNGKHVAAQAATRVQKLSGSIGDVAYRAVVSPDRAISSYVAALGNVVVVSNSLAQLERIVSVTQEKTPSLAGLDEYKYFRHRYRLGDAEESAFLMLSDATIRRWCGPRWRIADSRRTRAAAVLSELQAAHLDALARGSVAAGPVESPHSVPQSGNFELTPNGVQSSTYGGLNFLTPIAELDLKSVTQAEADAYRGWRDGYQSNWRRYFDPIAVRLTAQEDRIGADLTVMPLIAGTEYRDLIEVTRGAPLAPDAGDPHAGTLFHAVLALNPDAGPIRRFGAFAMTMAPGLTANPLGWLGGSLAIYADADPVWKEAFAAGYDQEFYETSLAHRLPMALRVDIANPLTAAGFLTSLRAFIEQTAPGITQWESIEFEGQSYVKISPTPEAGLPPEMAELAIYYAVTPRALTITLNEGLLHRVLRRDAKPSDEGTAEAAAEPDETIAAAERETKPVEGWLGESFAMRATQDAARLVEVLTRHEYETTLRLRSWSSLPILNTWKRLYPEQDPVALHERLWGVRLLCPGGGTYVWNEAHRTMESTAFGHPAEPKSGAKLPWPLRDYTSGSFGVTFEEQGLRARTVLERQARSEH